MKATRKKSANLLPRKFDKFQHLLKYFYARYLTEKKLTLFYFNLLTSTFLYRVLLALDFNVIMPIMSKIPKDLNYADVE